MLLLGRSLFGIAIVGFGALSLYYRDFVHQLQPVDTFLPPSTPGYIPLAILTGLFLIAAGAMSLRRAREFEAMTALAILFALWIVLLQIPSAFLHPQLLRSPWWVRTFEVVALIGAALILAGNASRQESPGWVLRGRILFGASLPVFGVLHLIYGPGTATLIPEFYPFPLFLAYFTGAAKIAAGIAIASGHLTRIAALLTALLYAIYTLTLHIPRQFLDHPPDAQRAGLTSMFIAIGFCGAALIVAATVQRRERVPTIGSAA